MNIINPWQIDVHHNRSIKYNGIKKMKDTFNYRNTRKRTQVREEVQNFAYNSKDK